MTQTIDLRQEDLAILRAVLRAHLPSDISIWVFGSRATGVARQYSDIDLALEGKEPVALDWLAQLRDALSESDLTIKADLLDLRVVDPAFRRRIAHEMVPLHLESECG